jgi:cell division ATPase FtsA
VGTLQEVSSLTYALDIGTRTIAGIVLERQADTYRIVAAKISEQEPGAMEDGQIHDVARVARTISQVTADLEGKLGVIPRQAAVAAAGRTLKTTIGSASHTVSPANPIDALTIQALEMQAVLQARESLHAHADASDTGLHPQTSWASAYIFVAYSPMTYYLDDEPIGNLTGHRGTTIGVDVIVTFLPRIVIDSLSASLTAAGLDVASLTLEPIAAIQAVVPVSMRRLKLALVDVGAGTSDIALTKDGIVFAYGMVSMAGNEITEALCQHYLLDFNEGERLKRQFQRRERLNVENVLGQSINPRPEEVAQMIKKAVETLAATIGQEILRLGEGTPQAVICIGGGSLTPYFPEALARFLEVPTSRVAVRGREALPNVEGLHDLLSGPDSVTPIAIAINGTTTTSLSIPITVNGRAVRLLGLSTPTVKDALIAAGIGLRELKGKPGAAITLTVNGEVKVIPGSMGKSAVIRIGNETATLDTLLQSQTNLTIEPPQPGEDAAPPLKEIAAIPPPLTIQWGETLLTVLPKILRNGKVASPEDIVADRDVIDITPRKHVGDVTKWLQDRGELADSTPLHYTLNGKQRMYRQGLSIWVNGALASDEVELENGDILQTEPDTEELTIGKLHELWPKELGTDTGHYTISVTFNGKLITLTHDAVWKYTLNGKTTTPNTTIHDGDTITITPTIDSEEPSFILSDVFRAADFKVPDPKARGKLQILLNGKPAGFTSPITDSDVIEIGWIKHTR